MKTYCSECNKEIETCSEDCFDDVQCSIECAEKAYEQNPEFCYICHYEIPTYAEWVNHSGKCKYCANEPD